MTDALLQLAVVLLLPPVLLGVINKTKALFAGRVGPPVLQLWFDLVKLMRKDTVLSGTTSWVFRAGPVVGLATTLFAALLVPIAGRAPLVSFEGDLVLFAYLLGLGRFFTVAAALDTGSSFEGMGGAREATFACLAEPALFLGLLALVRTSGSTSLGGMLGDSLVASWSIGAASLVAVVASLMVVLLAENSRIPFDDPNTHLELTMVHEAMVLDHGGPSLAMILYGAAIKLFVMGAIIVRIAVPYEGVDAWSGVAAFVAGMVLLAVVVGVVESVMARLRLLQVPSLLVAACVLSGFGVVLLGR
ncbi:MAG TPA: NADH-quinone oxidoreductase subunit H [Candidatus Binatia bacterium]